MPDLGTRADNRARIDDDTILEASMWMHERGSGNSPLLK